MLHVEDRTDKDPQPHDVTTCEVVMFRRRDCSYLIFFMLICKRYIRGSSCHMSNATPQVGLDPLRQIHGYCCWIWIGIPA
jgi:hypothetical protein